MNRAALILALLVGAGAAQARDCEYWRDFGFDIQLERQRDGLTLYESFEPANAFEWSIRNAVYQYPRYFGDDAQEGAAERFARDVYYDCRVRY